MKNFISAHKVFLLIFILISIILFKKLGTYSFSNWDECIYSEYARHMYETREYLTYSWNGEPILEKPPFHGWILQFAYLFGTQEWNARLPSLIAGLLLILFTTFFSYRLFGKGTSILAGFLLFSSNIYVLGALTVNTDMTFSLFIFLGIVFHLLSSKRSFYSYISGLFFGLAALDKGLSVFYFLIPMLLVILLRYKKSDLINILKTCITLLCIIAPWHIYEIVKNGQTFIYLYVVENLLVRASRSITFIPTDNLYYINILLRDFFPWNISLLLLLIQTIRQNHFNKINRTSLVLLLYPVFIVLLFSLSATRRANYILPMYPFIAVLIAYSINSAFRNRHVPIASSIIAILMIILTYFTYGRVVRFVQSTSVKTELLKIAQNHTTQQIDYFVDPVSRVFYEKNKSEKFFSLFHYGKNPCIVYYTSKKVNFYFNEEQFILHTHQNHGLYIISIADKHIIDHIPVHVITANTDFILFEK